MVDLILDAALLEPLLEARGRAVMAMLKKQSAA
jgi:hypothetical protein